MDVVEQWQAYQLEQDTIDALRDAIKNQSAWQDELYCCRMRRQRAQATGMTAAWKALDATQRKEALAAAVQERTQVLAEWNAAVHQPSLDLRRIAGDIRARRQSKSQTGSETLD